MQRTQQPHSAIRRLARAAACMLLAAATAAFAQAPLPQKPMRLVVPFPPGNAADIQARALADQLRKVHGLTAVVDNRPGASGAIALEHVAKSAADGTTLLVGSLSPLVITPATNKSLPYDTQRDFAPISLLGYNDVLLVAGPKFAGATVADLVAAAKAAPGAISFASIGNGTLAHLVMELVSTRASMKLLHVPYKGSGPAYTDLVGGSVDVMLDGMPQALAQVKGGRLRPLAVLSKRRSPLAPSIPTLAESQVAGLGDIEVLGWTGLLAPAGTSRELVERLNAETQKILAGDEMRALFGAQGLQAYPAHGPAYFADYIRAELASWRAMAQAAGLTN